MENVWTAADPFKEGEEGRACQSWTSAAPSSFGRAGAAAHVAGDDAAGCPADAGGLKEATTSRPEGEETGEGAGVNIQQVRGAGGSVEAALLGCEGRHAGGSGRGGARGRRGEEASVDRNPVPVEEAHVVGVERGGVEGDFGHVPDEERTRAVRRKESSERKPPPQSDRHFPITAHTESCRRGRPSHPTIPRPGKPAPMLSIPESGPPDLWGQGGRGNEGR